MSRYLEGLVKSARRPGGDVHPVLSPLYAREDMGAPAPVLQEGHAGAGAGAGAGADPTDRSVRGAAAGASVAVRQISTVGIAGESSAREDAPRDEMRPSVSGGAVSGLAGRRAAGEGAAGLESARGPLGSPLLPTRAAGAARSRSRPLDARHPRELGSAERDASVPGEALADATRSHAPSLASSAATLPSPSPATRRARGLDEEARAGGESGEAEQGVQPLILPASRGGEQSSPSIGAPAAGGLRRMRSRADESHGVEIHIGRIEVTAVTPAARPAPAARKTPSLDEYLKRGRRS